MMSRTKSGLAAALLVLSSFAPLFAHAAIASRAVLQTPIAVCVNGSPQITLSWGKLTGALSYSVFRLQKPQAQWLVPFGLSHIITTINVDKSVLPATTYQYQVKASFASGATYSNIVTVTAPKCTTSPTTTPPITGSSEVTLNAYLTGYGWPDNTPASAEISDGVIHSIASGAGTYTDPITIAVGHSIISGKDILDYPKGTKFYIPALHRYFIVEDTCGDGKSPQNGPCHTGFQGHVWLDAWVGGTGANSASVLNCEDKITDFHTVIQNPVSNYTVTSGPVFNGTCSPLYSEIPTKI